MNTIIVECPNEIYSLKANSLPKVFLAGGITIVQIGKKNLLFF